MLTAPRAAMHYRVDHFRLRRIAALTIASALGLLSAVSYLLGM